LKPADINSTGTEPAPVPATPPTDAVPVTDAAQKTETQTDTAQKPAVIKEGEDR
jgi:hypothetical protein